METVNLENNRLPVRKKNRLKEYDYSTNGAYFVTICTQNKQCTLGSIVGDGSPVPKAAGRIAEKWIAEIPKRFPQAKVEAHIVMPNHIHLLMSLTRNEADKSSPTVSDMVAWYKYQVTKEINAKKKTPGERFFQRSFHDHVVRGEKDYEKIWDYIHQNPLRWQMDCFYREE